MDNQVIEKLREEYAGKKVLVVGLGLQGGGVGVVRFFAELGARVKATDKKTKKDLDYSLQILKDLPIDYTLGSHDLNDFLEADVIFKGPSVPWDMPEIIEASKKNIPVEMETSFFMTHSPSKNIIGVTGTRGKSTTTMMIYELLKKTGRKVFMGGNIPNISTISLLKNIQKEDYIILELPSWHLSGLARKKISPHIAIFTNFYPDHLNYYKNMEDYLLDKKAIYLNQSSDDYLIFNGNFKNLIENDNIKSKVTYFSKSDFPAKLIYLRGEHNLENAACSLKLAEFLQINHETSIETISNYKGLHFREEIVAEKDGIVFINDTTSTSPTSTIKAIQAFSKKTIVLILGGQDKNLPINDLTRSLDDVREIVLLKGSFTDKIFPSLQAKFKYKIHGIYNDLEKAVGKAYVLAKKHKENNPKIYILFSPGATSFAMFQNEFHRGGEFNRIVKKILTSNGS